MIGIIKAISIMQFPVILLIILFGEFRLTHSQTIEYILYSIVFFFSFYTFTEIAERLKSLDEKHY